MTPLQIAKSMPFWNDTGFWEKQYVNQHHYAAALSRRMPEKPGEEYEGWKSLKRSAADQEIFMGLKHLEVYARNSGAHIRLLDSTADVMSKCRYINPLIRFNQ